MNYQSNLGKILGEKDDSEQPVIILYWLAELLRLELAYQSWLDWQQVSDNGEKRRSKFVRYIASAIPLNKEIKIT